MESEPVKENLFYLSDKVFNLAKDIIKNPFDYNICNTINVNKSDEKQKYEIYNNFIAYLLVSILDNTYIKSELKVYPDDELTNIDDKYKDDALRNIYEVFKRGHNKGFDFFKSNRKDYYYRIMPNDKDDFIDDFISDLFKDQFGFYDDKKMTFQKYIGIIPHVFNEQTMFNFGFVNGAYNAFIEFTKDMPYSVKSKVFDYIESPKTSNKTDKESIKHPFKNAPKQYCIIAQLLATNEIQIIDKEYKFKGVIYPNGNQLNKAINHYFKPDKEYKFTQYLNDFKDQKRSDKNLLDIKDINNNRDKKKVNSLRIIKKYFEDNNIHIINKDFKQILKEI